MITTEPITLVRITLDTVSGTPQTAGVYLFSEHEKPLHTNPAIARPYLAKDIYLGQEIMENVTLSGKMSLLFYDDFEVNGASFWRKWLSANPYYRNRIVEVLRGFAGDAESSCKLAFKGILQDVTINKDSTVEITAKELLKLSEKNFPRETDGENLADIASGDSVIIMKPNTGLDLSTASGSQYDASGYIRIDNEIIQYTSVSDISEGAKTQFRFNGCLRGQFNVDGWSLATGHSANTNIQQAIVFNGISPVDAIESLLGKAGLNITAGTGDLDNGANGSFAEVKAHWMQGLLVRGVLDKPGPIKTYLKELREISLCSLFQNENQQIQIDYLAPRRVGETLKAITDADNIIFASSEIRENRDNIITRIITYYNLLPDKGGSSDLDYTHKIVYIDYDIETKYHENIARVIRSRWLKSDLGGPTYVPIMARHLIKVHGQGKRVIKFELELKDDSLQVGDNFYLTTAQIQDASGNPVNSVLFHVVKKEQSSLNTYSYTAYDTRIDKRIAYICPDNMANYTSATKVQQDYGFIANSSGVMSNNNDSYFLL